MKTKEEEEEEDVVSVRVLPQIIRLQESRGRIFSTTL